MHNKGRFMKILHTSDWHIGKKLEGKSRLQEQRKVLEEIVSIADENNVELVLIAGDVYDTFLPSAESEQLFFDVLSKLSNGKRPIIVVSGNHDDAVRLNCARSISYLADVYFSDGDQTRVNDRVLESGSRVLSAKNGGFVVESKGQKLFVGTLSYPNEYKLKEKIDENETYNQKVARWIGEVFSLNEEKLPQILVSHLFMIGGETSGSEREIELGGARIVDVDVIPKECLYSALGHLHKRQIVSKSRNIVYSGSILQYHFDESGYQKSVTIVDVENNQLQKVEEVKLHNYVNLYRISANSLQEGIEKIEGIDGYIELTLTLDKPLDSLDHKAFCDRFPNVFLKLKFKGGEVFVSDRRTLEGKDLFIEYYKSVYGDNPDQKIVDLFVSLLSEEEIGNASD